MKYDITASKETVDLTMAALKNNGIEVYFVANGGEAKQKVTELIPDGSEVMTMTSVTLDTTGINDMINESGKYNSVRKIMGEMGEDKISEKRKLGAGPDYAIGSVHAVTQNGEVLIASNTGSQLPAYAYGAGKVIWVVGTHKIVADKEAGLRRIYDYVLPLEGERANKAYSITTGSEVRKLLAINSEGTPGRLNIIFVDEALGF